MNEIIIKASVYTDENYHFNAAINKAVSSICQTKDSSPIMYVKSTFKNFEDKKRYYNFKLTEDIENKIPRIDERFKKDLIKHPALGPLEYYLASVLLDQTLRYDVIILLGTLGSGKSALCSFVLEYLEKLNSPETDGFYFPSTGTIFSIDFNAHISDSPKELLHNIKGKLISELILLIQGFHNRKFFLDEFLKEIQNKTVKYVDFIMFPRDFTEVENKSREHQFTFLLRWITKTENFLSLKIDLLSLVLTFLKEKQENKCIDFILFLDNIDKFDDASQIEILDLIFSFSAKIPTIKILVPMRLTTYGKVKGAGSHNFFSVTHTGHPPIDIFKLRIQHFLNTLSTNNELAIPKDFLRFFLHKLQYIEKCFGSDREFLRIRTFFNALSGNSIRRGLYLGERLFINSVAKFDDTNLIQDDFLRALLCYRSNKISHNDNSVKNIFSNLEHVNTLLCIRILQILLFFSKREHSCTTGILYNQISYLGEYSRDEILYAVNSLALDRRKLVYIDGVSAYLSFEELIKSSNDVIQISYTGTKYVENLIFDVVYLQTCFTSINWGVSKRNTTLRYLNHFLEIIPDHLKSTSTEYLKSILHIKKHVTVSDFINAPYDFSEIQSRMKMLRECLYFLMLTDLNGLGRYYKEIQSQFIEEKQYINESVLISMITKVSKNVLAILALNFTKNEEEIKSWYNLLLVVSIWHEIFFKTRHRKLDLAIALYREKLGIK